MKGAKPQALVTDEMGESNEAELQVTPVFQAGPLVN